MIRINLIPQRRPKRSEQGQQSLLLGVLAILAAGALIYLLIHRPLEAEVDTLQTAVDRLKSDNKGKQDRLKGAKEKREAFVVSEERSQVVADLSLARAIPAHMLYELSNLVTANGGPTMTKATILEIAKQIGRQPNLEWDPTHVWMTGFTVKKGEFALTGGAQSDSDMTQLALRLQASVYFRDVIPSEGAVVIDKDSGITYYKFTITGKVAY